MRSNKTNLHIPIYPEAASVGVNDKLLVDQGGVLKQIKREKIGVTVLGQGGAPVGVGGTTAETTLATVVLPAGVMGPSGAIRVTNCGTVTNSANSKTIKIKLGSTAFSTIGYTTQATFGYSRTIRNRNADNSQFAYGGSSESTSVAVITGTIDTTVEQTLTITGQTTLETGFTPTQANMSGNGSVVTVVQTSHGLNTGEWISATGSSTSGYNAASVAVTRIDANTFSYPGTGTGTPTTSPLIQRYSVLTLEGYTVELVPG
jgi:hypothetical protein